MKMWPVTCTLQGIGALLADLKQRGMLDSTLVIIGGEFGRTPTVELNSTGETANPGLFVLGDAASGGGRLAEASFADGARAASALSRRLSAPLAPGFRLGAA